MTNQQILTKAIQKAIDGGYSGSLPVASDSPSHEWSLYGLIFNHDFAKALWGEECSFKYEDHIHEPNEGSGGCLPWYLNHLQGMVIAEDPIKYLGEHI